jgi:hypothetical protein
MFIRYLLMFPFQFLLNILTYILAFPLALLSVAIGRDVLPYPLSLFHTHDDTLDGGQHQLGWPKASGMALVIQRTKWIMRNPAYGFAAYWFGFPHYNMKTRVHWTKGDLWDSNKTCVEYHKMEQGDRFYFSWRAQLVYSKKHHVKLWFGWHFDDKHTGYHMLKLNVHPYKANL